jgi:hypothetical protein
MEITIKYKKIINDAKRWLFDKMKKTDKLLAKLTKERPKLINLEKKNGASPQEIPIKCRSLGNTLTTYILINWKI